MIGSRSFSIEMLNDRVVMVSSLFLLLKFGVDVMFLRKLLRVRCGINMFLGLLVEFEV